MSEKTVFFIKPIPSMVSRTFPPKSYAGSEGLNVTSFCGLYLVDEYFHTGRIQLGVLTSEGLTPVLTH